MYLPLPCRLEKICPENKVSIVQLILQSVVVCINGLNVTFRARWFHRVFPTERRDCDCHSFPPPLGSRRLRSRNCLHLTSIPLSFNKPASGRKYQIIFIATRRRLLVIDGKGPGISLMLLCKFTGMISKANGDPRTDVYALKKRKRSIQTSSACD